ncbi:hypothetical protein GCM10028805_54750 [Spirosoma harenae]
MTEPLIHRQQAHRCVNTDEQAGTVTIVFREIRLTLSWRDVDILLNGQQHWWILFYQVGLLDVRDTCIRTGFRGLNLPITLQEYDEFNLILQQAYLNDD